MIGIYKITNKINGKSYIGQSNNIKKRWNQHKKCIGSNRNPMYLDFEKYGIDNFIFEVIEECTIQDLDNREIYWIEYYDSYKNGYNLTIGGQGMNSNSMGKMIDESLFYKKITAKHWKVYYYMLSVSKFNSSKVEDHRYIYKKDFNISQACRDLGIKSNQTFYNALKRLEAHKLVKVKDDNYFLYAQNWIDINKEVLSALIKYAKQEEQDIDLLRTFLILKKLNKIAQSSEERSFTLRQLSVLLGHGDTTSEYYKKIRIYLALLSFWNMIELKQHKHYDNNLNTAYTIYHLQMVSESNLSPDFNINIEEEMLAPLPSEELMDKLKFCYPELLE